MKQVGGCRCRGRKTNQITFKSHVIVTDGSRDSHTGQTYTQYQRQRQKQMLRI